jgi:hypothetical protein
MSDDTTKPAATFANWVLSVAGVLGSLVIVTGVLAVSYLNTRPTEKVNADVVAARLEKLKGVQAAEAQLYNSYGWVNQAKGIVRIPVEVAMGLIVERLGKATKNQPPAPARLSLAGSPEAMTPLPPPVTTAPVAAKPAPAKPAAVAPAPKPTAPAAPASTPPATPAPATPSPAAAPAAPAAPATAGTAAN